MVSSSYLVSGRAPVFGFHRTRSVRESSHKMGQLCLKVGIPFPRQRRSELCHISRPAVNGVGIVEREDEGEGSGVKARLEARRERSSEDSPLGGKPWEGGKKIRKLAVEACIKSVLER
jgi:hypothetical protein